MAGRLDPVPFDRRLLLRIDGPVRLEAAEVIQAHIVIQGQRATEPRNPPIEAALLQQRPLVQRIAPALPRRGEVVRRHAGYTRRPPAFVQFEDLRVGPHVRTVVGDEDCDIAQDADLALGTIAAQRRPLLLEEELDYLLDRQLAPRLVHDGGQGIGVAESVLFGPVNPAFQTKPATQYGEQCPVGEPRNVVLSEFLKATTILRAGVVEEVGCRFFHQRQLSLRGCGKVTGPLVTRQPQDALLGDPALLDQALQADQRCVARKRGQRRIRRAAVTSRVQRQNLPEALFRRNQKVDEAVCRGTEVPDASIGRQRSDMQQNAGKPLGIHSISQASTSRTASCLRRTRATTGCRVVALVFTLVSWEGSVRYEAAASLRVDRQPACGCRQWHARRCSAPSGYRRTR